VDNKNVLMHAKNSTKTSSYVRLLKAKN